MQETSCTGSRAWKNKTRAWLLWSSNSPAILNVGFSIWFKDYGEQSIGHNRDHQDAADAADEEHPTQKVRENCNHRFKHSAPICEHYSTKNKRGVFYLTDRKEVRSLAIMKGRQGPPSE